MIDIAFIDDLSKKLSEAIPEGVRASCDDAQKNFASILQTSLSKLDLVTRQEFDAQVAVLQRTRQKLDELEQLLKAQQK